MSALSSPSSGYTTVTHEQRGSTWPAIISLAAAALFSVLIMFLLWQLLSGRMDVSPVRKQVEALAAQAKTTDDTLNRLASDFAAFRAGGLPASGAAGGVVGLTAFQTRLEELTAKVDVLTKQMAQPAAATAASASPAASAELAQRLANMESKFAAMSDAIGKLAADRNSGKAGLEMLIMQQAALRDQVNSMGTSPAASPGSMSTVTAPQVVAMSEAEAQRMREFERELREMQEVVRTLRINTAVAPGVMPDAVSTAAPSGITNLPPTMPVAPVAVPVPTAAPAATPVSNPPAAAPAAAPNAFVPSSAAGVAQAAAGSPATAASILPPLPAAPASSAIVTVDGGGNIVRVPASSMRSLSESPTGSAIRPAVDGLPVGARDMRPRVSIVTGQPLVSTPSSAVAAMAARPAVTSDRAVATAARFDPYDPAVPAIAATETISTSQAIAPVQGNIRALAMADSAAFMPTPLVNTSAAVPVATVGAAPALSAEPLPANRRIKPTSVGSNWAQNNLGWLGWPIDAAGNLFVLIGEGIDSVFTGTEFVSREEWDKMGGK